MLSKLTFVLSALIGASFLDGSQSNKIGYYTVVAPGTIRSESVFYISITLNDFHQSCWFNISLQNFNHTARLFGYEGIEVEPRTTKLVTLEAPYLTGRLGHLEVFGYRGITTSIESAMIFFENKSYSTFIQINKAKFKPGQLVEFRVICVDQLTRPAKVNHKISVQIFDGRDNLLKMIYDVKFVQGVFRSEYQLSDNPVLGEWQINVEINGDVVAEKGFEVARYVLPKFAVQMQTNSNVAIHEGVLTLGISSSNFYGEPVKGNLTITLREIYANIEESPPVLRTTYQIDGNTTIILDIATDLHLKNKIRDNTSVILNKFNIEAFVIDELSEEKSQTEIEVAVHSQPYKIKVQAPEVFQPDKFIILKIQVLVTDLQDNPIQDIQHQTKVFVECNSVSIIDFDKQFNSEYEIQAGNDYASINVTNNNFRRCHLHAEYRGSKSSVSQIKRNYNAFYLDVLTQSPEVGTVLKVRLSSLDPIDDFTYQIVSKGDIIQSERVNVPKEQKSYILRFHVTFLMVPKIIIYIHGIKNGKFIGQLKDVYIKRAFNNSIKITTTDETTRPGSSVNINVTTDEGSYVGLMGLDYRILQNIRTIDDLTEDNFYTKLRNYDSLSLENSINPLGAKAGLVTFTNAPTHKGMLAGFGWGQVVDDDDEVSKGDSGSRHLFPLTDQFEKLSPSFPFIRKLFSESWLFRDFQKTTSGGFNIMETIPDTITSWAITGFSLNPITGLSLSRDPTNLRVFQEFFILINLPSLVKEGEIIEVSAYIKSNMSQGSWTNVTITTDSDYLEILEHPEEQSIKIISKLIPKSESEKIIFFLRPLKQGQYKVLCSAITPNSSDAIQKALNVQPQGIPYAMSKTYLVHLPKEGSQEDEITIDIPVYTVPESQRVEISVVGDIFRPLLRNLQKLARAPYGNGEDNMRYIVSNLLVLKYLKALNYSKPSLESKIRLNLELGYQNQLSFKHLDGSFGLFERTIHERTGNIWQTAFALWGLKQASDFIQIDFRIIERGLRYLQSKQLDNGCFESQRYIQDVKSTAFSLMVFLMDKYSKAAFSEIISRGLQCLSDRANSLKNSSSFVLSALVLALGNHEKVGDYLSKLTYSSYLTEKIKQKLWTRKDNFDSNLETITGNLISVLEPLKESSHQNSNVLQILKELFNFKTDRSSSIIHMIALKELIGFVQNLRTDRKNLNITFNDDQKGSGNFKVNSDNSQVLQTFKISRKSRKIHIRSSGHGLAVLEVKYRYNIVPVDQYSSIFITNITSQMSSKTMTVLELCPTFEINNIRNKLVVMQVKLQSGYAFSERSSIEDDNYLKNEIKSIQLNDNRDTVVVYFENIPNNGICLTFKAYKDYKVLNAKPGWVIVYDLDEKDSKTVKSFFIDDSCL